MRAPAVNCQALCRRAGLALALAASAALSGCASLLPSGEAQSPKPWASFEQAHGVYERIVPQQTTLADLHHLGIDPNSTPNLTILSYADIVSRLVPPSREAPLDPGIRACLDVPNQCHGYEITQKLVQNRRVGNFWADFFAFKRQTDTSGWRFSLIVLTVGDRVVYKTWGGQPKIEEQSVTRNPLGPLQGLGESGLGGINSLR